MADTGDLNLKLLQRATPRDQALHLRRVLDSNPAAVSSLTSQLISLVAAEILPPIVLCLWPSVTNQPEVIVAVIRQDLCINAHHSAIKHFYRHLRREKTFAEAWEAAGGAQGIAQLAAKLSVHDVRFLLSLLGDTSRAQGARKQRQREMEQLLELLWGQTEDNEERVAFDSRPLREAYAKLLPACGPAFRVEWEENEKKQLQKRYEASVETDCDFFESHYDGKLGRNEITGYGFLIKVKPLVLNRPEYGLQVFERFLDSENLLGVSPDALIDSVVDPVGKRLLSKRRISDGITQRFWTRVVQGLKDRSEFHRSFDKSEYGFHKTVAHLVDVWNHSCATAEYTEMLATLFSLLPEAKVSRSSLPDLLRRVGESRRYQLMRLFFKHTAGNGIDVGEPTSLDYSELEKLSFRWQSEVFFLLPAEQALILWEKVQRAGQDVGRNGGHGQRHCLYEKCDPERREVADRHVVRALLLNQVGNPAASAFSPAELEAMRAEVRQEVFRRMRKATQGRSADDRLQAALSALTLCVAIGDLELYAETLRWARRFNKDPLTVKELYSRHCYMTREGDDLLAVLHEKKDKVLGISVDELTKKIHSANAVLTILFETAGMGVNEPSFNPADWKQTFELIQRVVALRLNWVNDFQDRTKMSDDSLYEAVWKPTSDMLEMMLSDLFGPVGDRFESIAPYATLSTLRVTEPQKLRGHAIKFLDRLAEFQDSLWAEVRRRETPALVTADEIWPKGATLQQLSSYFGEPLVYLPYTQARIEAVVFMNPHKALRPIEIDEEAQLAIGTYVDSWPRALQLYIQMPGEERKERIRRAWLQATVVLSKDRISPEEAERFWWPVFQGVGVEQSEVGVNEKEDQRREPSLPDVDEDEDLQPLEWNPDPEYDRLSQPERNRALTPNLLDVLLSRPTEGSTARFTKAQSSIFGDVKAVIPGKPRPCSLWSSFFYSSKRRVSVRSADAYAAAAILAVNMRHGSDMSLLKTPFPNANSVRIPAVYLDQEFLERETDKSAWCYGLDVLAALSHYTPIRLLVQLAESVFKSIRRKPEAEKPYAVFVAIVKSILNGRDPSLAIPLIQQFVLENPDASSWHRPILNPGSLEKLSPGDAKRFIESFTDALLDKLQEQVERRADEEGRDNAAARKVPLVKITTVKMLSQLLRESPVVGPSLAVDLNIRILKRASHVDIRTATVKGLTEAIANTTTSSVVKKRVFDALREYAVPIASSINESRPFTDWDALTPGSDLPDIWEEGSGFQTMPPIMNLILEAGHGMGWKSDEGRELKEITYSMLDASAETNKRWMSLFLEKNGFNLPEGAQLPAIPLFPTSLESLLSIMRSEISDRYADLAMEYLLLRTNPPEWLNAVTQAVRDNKKLAYTHSCKHWSQMWNSDGDMFMKRLFLKIHSYLDTVERGVKRGEIQKREGYQSMDSYLFDIADAVLMRGELSKFEALMEDTSTFDRDSPVWGRIVERIDELRTPTWQSDPNRKPAVLPDTLGLRVRMLNLPRLSPSTPDEAKEVAVRCAKGAVKLLEEIVADQRPYARSFSTLQKALEAAEPKAELGIAIAATPALDDASVVTLVDYLRVELAAELLDKSHIFKKGFGKPHEEDLVKRATEVVMKMSGSRVEEFRTLAAGLRMDIENADGWGWWS